MAAAAIRYFPNSIFFAGRVIDSSQNSALWGILHDEVSFIIQDRLQKDGFSMMIVPVHVRGMPSKLPNITLPIDMDQSMQLVQPDTKEKNETHGQSK